MKNVFLSLKMRTLFEVCVLLRTMKEVVWRCLDIPAAFKIWRETPTLVKQTLKQLSTAQGQNLRVF